MPRNEAEAPPRPRDEPRERLPASRIQRLVAWSIDHRAKALLGWLALVLVAVVATGLVPGRDALGRDPGESGRAQHVLRDQESYEPSLENVLIQRRGSHGRAFAEDTDMRAATQDLVSTLNGLPGAVANLRSPLDNNAQVSKDGRSGLVSFFLAGPNKQMSKHYIAIVDAVGKVQQRHPEIRVVQAGDRSLNRAVDDAVQDDFGRAEKFSLPLTAVILLIVFGSLLAASIPLLLAATTSVATFGLMAAVGKVISVNSATSSMILLVGVAVSIDYSLFYLRREREERAAGKSVGQALQIAARTSGRVVVVSGLTVILCVAGLVFTGLDNFRGLTVGTALVVGLAVLGSVTALPALLALLGDRVEKLRVPWLGRRRTEAGRSKVWFAVAQAVVRRPLLWGGAAVLALLVMALPALDMRLQDAGPTNSLPRSVPTVDAAVRMQESFPGAASPAKVVVSGDVSRTALDRSIEQLHGQVAAHADLFAEPLSVQRVDNVTIIRVPLAGGGTDDRSNRGLETLREQALPDTVGKAPGAEFDVSGKTAFAYDFTERVRDTMPIVFAFVLLLSFVLLAVAFRSLAIPLVSIALNLLSIGAAYGVLTWVFQDGHLGSVLGLHSYGGVVGWIPLFMFALLFGLSMDYHIFILSRIRERWLAGTSTRFAVVDGIGSSAGVVTSAAAIMTGVFSVFIVLSAIEYKMLGVGMATAIVIDATLVRGVLLPAAIALLGERVWVLPGVRGARRRTGDPSPTS
ncbi:MMPL family transporter [Embleya sp. NBC_00888]|uniref:MMPL family transporter n=1 Tax=Embleya sp. NBC_00888 TaxID=2975960 RepID=UPI00386DDDBE|nr:MMPL family transporter [Embleya sp. NBC_00888]